ncbi:hypothetical protein CRUP_032033 [Coryphaenoides rupestris]|nr:hypothetical protein CRUP_032033 [Coryphaenoides rupestris]
MGGASSVFRKKGAGGVGGDGRGFIHVPSVEGAEHDGMTQYGS